MRFPRRPRRSRQLAAGPVFAAAALVAPLPGAAQNQQAAQNEIRTALESWRSAFNERDSQRVCSLFAPDVVANYEDRPELDYAALCELLQGAMRDRDRTYRYSLKIGDIVVDGDAAVVRLVWTLEIAEPAAPSRTLEEPAVDVFRRQADGSWKISRYLAYPSKP